MIGQRISHYKVTAELGRGGMGVVYKAEDTKLDRPVALKFLAPHLVEDEEARQRFVREAKAAAALDHPNICTVYEIDEADGQSFIAMAYLEGESLQAKIESGPFKIDAAIETAIQMARGLAAAHQKDIVHRDIKPANVMITVGGAGIEPQAKLMDFGLAQLKGKTRLTKEGTTLGTVAYMSPEQAQGLDLDRRSDIWSLGVVLYEMVSGRLPFQGEYDQAILYGVLHEDPEPLTGLRTGVPKELERIANKALAKEPSSRYQHVDDMLVDLSELKRSRESDSTRPGPPAAAKQPGKTWLAGALAAALGIAALIALWPGVGGEPENAAPVYQETPLTSYPGVEREPTFSPDGSQVAFAWNGPNEDNFDTYVQVVGSANPVRITSDPAEDSYPSWSPDGRLIAFARVLEGRRAVYVVPPLGGQERRILDAGPACGTCGRPAWFADGKSLAVSVRPGPGRPTRIMRVPVEAGTPEVLVSPESEESRVLFPGDSNPAFSPDGKTLAWRRAGNRRTLLTKELGEADVLEVAEIGLGGDVVWSSDGGRLLFTTGENIHGGATSRLLQIPAGGGSPEPVPGVSAGANDPAVSRLGNRLAYARVYEDSNIWRVDLDPGVGERQRRKLAPSTRAETVPRVSPSGEQVVFVSNRAGEHRQIWVCNSDGANLRQITSFADRPAGSPRWSPNGRMIAFDSLVEGNWQTFVVNADGGQARQITSGNYSNSRPAWSSDSQSLYFYSPRDGRLAIWKVPVEGGEAVRLTDAPANDPFESRDGRWLYFERENRLWKAPAGGGGPKRLFPRKSISLRLLGVLTDRGTSTGSSATRNPASGRYASSTRGAKSAMWLSWTARRKAAPASTSPPMERGSSTPKTTSRSRTSC